MKTLITITLTLICLVFASLTAIAAETGKATEPAVKSEAVKAPAVPQISDAQKAKWFKLGSWITSAQLQQAETQKRIEALKPEIEKAQTEMTAVCGSDYQLDQDRQTGDPYCAPKPKVEAKAQK